MVRCVRGEMGLAVDIAPRFDYGRQAHRTDVTARGVVFGTDEPDRKAQPGTGERDRPRGRELIAASGTGWLGYRR